MKRQRDPNMLCGPTDSSCIKRYFSGSTILVTGATGFLGRLVIEKLLRTCSDLNIIYALIRSKKGKTCVQRFQEYFDDPVYDRLKSEKPETMAKLRMIESDFTFPYLGLAEHDREVIISEVNCIFHIAATVNFNEHLKTATYINVKATKHILKLAKNVRNLSSFIYVSTAYSFCPREIIDEVFYEPGLTGDQILAVVECLNEDMLERVCPILLGNWPNTYTFTKSIAEDIIKKESDGLPLAVVRPSIMLTTFKEPVSGWINNDYGAVGGMMAVNLGLIHTAQVGLTLLADIIPAEYVANAIIAAAWDVARTRNFNGNLEIYQENCNSVRIYNCVSSPENPISWKDVFDKSRIYTEKMPTTKQVWIHSFMPTTNRWVFSFLWYSLHSIPAYILDFLSSCVGKKPRMVQIYKKMEKRLNLLIYFAVRQWTFRNANIQELWKKLNREDKKLFQFSVKLLDWDTYFYKFARGARIYLLKDSWDTIPQGHAKRVKLRIAHYSVVTTLVLIVVLIVWYILVLLHLY